MRNRIAGEIRQRCHAIWQISSPDHFERQPVVERQTAVGNRNKYQRQRDGHGFHHPHRGEHLVAIDALQRLAQRQEGNHGYRKADSDAEQPQSEAVTHHRDDISQYGWHAAPLFSRWEGDVIRARSKRAYVTRRYDSRAKPARGRHLTIKDGSLQIQPQVCRKLFMRTP